MTDCQTETLTISLPSERVRQLEAFAKAANSPIGNAASRAIEEGIRLVCDRNPNLRISMRAALGDRHE